MNIANDASKTKNPIQYPILSVCLTSLPTIFVAFRFLLSSLNPSIYFQKFFLQKHNQDFRFCFHIIYNLIRVSMISKYAFPRSNFCNCGSGGNQKFFDFFSLSLIFRSKISWKYFSFTIDHIQWNIKWLYLNK